MKQDPDKPKQAGKEPRRRAMRWLIYSLGAIVIVSLLYVFSQQVVYPSISHPTNDIPYSDFKEKLLAGQIIEATVGPNRITGKMKNPQATTDMTASVPFVTTIVPTGDPKLVDEMVAAGVKFSAQTSPSPTGQSFLYWLMPIALLGGVFFLFSRNPSNSKQAGNKSLFGVSQSKATRVEAKDISITFHDVGGVDEAIVELQEIIDFLKAPERFANLGGRIPKGVLLVGPPGTGKTLLAKATAGEASVAFFESSGSEFVEMFVGVGAARVRDLFERARKEAPAIIFIDEIDAIGQSRTGSSNLGGNDEREQTLNQLLAEIDGFKTDPSAPVVIMAATNRPDVLDPALLRAGRFDRQVAVGQPDLAGRLQILRIHSQKIRLADEFDLERAARITPGFSGADLENVLNESALLAARRQAEAVTMAEFEAAIERVVAGLERKTRLMNEQERKTVAYHESGHALVAALSPHADPIAKISIVPRGIGALGYVLQMPVEDRYLLARDELEDRIAVMMGGRAAEQVIFGKISTGASDDIQKATELARRMVTEFGMSEKLGPVRYAGQQLQYLAGPSIESSQVSGQTRVAIDEEIKRIVTDQYQRVQDILNQNLAALHELARLLLEQETLNGNVVDQILGKS